MNKSQLLQSLEKRGFSKQIITAFSKVKREDFVPEKIKSHAYEDTALPIGKGQTISQPYTIAMMLSLLELRKGQKVLELGSGCGYVLALMSEITGSNGKIFGVEIIKELAEKSKKNLKNYKNIKVYHGNAMEIFSKSSSRDFHQRHLKKSLTGTGREIPKNRLGSFDFDRILISAACEEIPKKVLSQLKDNGIIAAPVGAYGIEQSLVAVQKKKNKVVTKKQIPGFVFVKFVSHPNH